MSFTDGTSATPLVEHAGLFHQNPGQVACQTRQQEQPGGIAPLPNQAGLNKYIYQQSVIDVNTV